MNTKDHRRAVQEAILDLFATTTNIPITLFELRQNGELDVVTPLQSRAQFADFCNALWNLPGGRSTCERDMKERARTVFQSGRHELTCCHAGLYNQLVPIVMDGKVRAVVAYGEVNLAGDVNRHASYVRFNEFSEKMEFTHQQRSDLRMLHVRAAPYSMREFERVHGVLDNILQLLYAVLDREEESRKNTEHVKHELQMRLQSLLPAIESLDANLPNLSAEETKEKVSRVFGAAKGMRTVLHTLTSGQFLEQYHFKEQPIWPLIHSSKTTYEPEAFRRGIEIAAHTRHASMSVEISREHFQLALDNIIYNAVKYSYQSAEDRHRYVRISDDFDGKSYSVTIANYGVGILPQEIDTGLIFQDGYQGELTKGEFRTGSGKGLAFAQQVIKRHNGYIAIKSEPQATDDVKGLFSDRSSGGPYLTQVRIVIPHHQPNEVQTHA